MFTGIVHHRVNPGDPPRDPALDPDAEPAVDVLESLKKLDPDVLLNSTLHDIVDISRKTFIRAAADSVRQLRSQAPTSEALVLFRSLVGRLTGILDELSARTPRFESCERAYQLFVDSEDPSRQLAYARQLVQENRARHEQVEMACHVYRGKLERREKVLDYIRSTLLSENVRLQEQIRLRHAGEHFEDEVVNLFDFAPILQIIKDTSPADEPLEAVFATDPHEVHRMVDDMHRRHAVEKSRWEAEHDAQEVLLFNKERELDEVMVDLANLRKSFAVEYATLKQEMAAARVEAVNTLQQQISTQASEFRQIRADLEKELRAANLEVTRLGDLLGQQAADQERYERDIARLDGQLRTSQRRLDADRATHVNELREVNERHRQEMEKLRTRNDTELEKLRTSYEGAARAVELRMQADVDDLSAELAESRAGHLAQSAMVQAQHQRQLRAAQDTAKGDLQTVAATLDEVNRGMNREHVQLTRRVDELRGELQNALDGKAQVQSRLFASEMRLTAAERELDTLQKGRAKLREARTRAEQQASEATTALIDERTSLNARIDGLTDRVKELEGMLQLESQTFSQRETQQRLLMREYEDRVTKLAAANDSLRVELSTLQTVANEESSEMFQTAYAQVQERLQRKQEELMELQNELSGAAQTLRQFSMNILGDPSRARRNTHSQSISAEDPRKRAASLRSHGASSVADSAKERRPTVMARSHQRGAGGRKSPSLPAMPNGGSPVVPPSAPRKDDTATRDATRRSSRRTVDRRKDSVKSDGAKSSGAPASSVSSKTGPDSSPNSPSASQTHGSSAAHRARTPQSHVKRAAPAPPPSASAPDDEPEVFDEVIREGNASRPQGSPGRLDESMRRVSGLSAGSVDRDRSGRAASSPQPAAAADAKPNFLAVAFDQRRGSAVSNVTGITTTTSRWVQKMDGFRFGEKDDEAKLTRQRTEHAMMGNVNGGGAEERAIVAQKFTKLVHGGEDADSVDESDLLREVASSSSSGKATEPAGNAAAAADATGQTGAMAASGDGDGGVGVVLQVPHLAQVRNVVSERGSDPSAHDTPPPPGRGHHVAVQCSNPVEDMRRGMFRSASMRGGSDDGADDAVSLSSTTSIAVRPEPQRSSRLRRLLWTCPSFECGRGLLDSNFCPQCATPRPSDADPTTNEDVAPQSDTASVTTHVATMPSPGSPAPPVQHNADGVAAGPMMPLVPRAMPDDDDGPRLPTYSRLGRLKDRDRVASSQHKSGSVVSSKVVNASSPRHKRSTIGPSVAPMKRGLQQLDLDAALPVQLTQEFYTAFTQTDDSYLRLQRELAHARRQLLARTMELETILASAEANPQASATMVVREFAEGLGAGLLARVPQGLTPSEVGPPPTEHSPTSAPNVTSPMLEAVTPFAEQANETTERLREDTVKVESSLRDALRMRKLEVIRQLAASRDGFRDADGQLVVVDEDANIIRQLQQELQQPSASELAPPLRTDAMAGWAKPHIAAQPSAESIGLGSVINGIPTEPSGHLTGDSVPRSGLGSTARSAPGSPNPPPPDRATRKGWDEVRSKMRSSQSSRSAKSGTATRPVGSPPASRGATRGASKRPTKASGAAGASSPPPAYAAGMGSGSFDVDGHLAPSHDDGSDPDTPRALREAQRFEDLSTRLHDMVVRNNALLDTIREQAAMLRQVQSTLKDPETTAELPAAAAAAAHVTEVLRVADEVMSNAAAAMAATVADTEAADRARRRAPRGVSFGESSEQEPPLWVLKLKELEARLEAEELGAEEREKGESAGRFVRLYEVAARRLSAQFEELAVQGGLVQLEALGVGALSIPRPSTSHTAASGEGTVVGQLPRREAPAVRSRSGSRYSAAGDASMDMRSSSPARLRAEHTLREAIAGAESLALGVPSGSGGMMRTPSTEFLEVKEPKQSLASLMDAAPLPGPLADSFLNSSTRGRALGGSMRSVVADPLAGSVSESLNASVRAKADASLGAELAAALRRESAMLAEVNQLRRRVAALSASSMSANPSRINAEQAAYLAAAGPAGAAFSAGLPAGHLPSRGSAGDAVLAANAFLDRSAAVTPDGSVKRPEPTADVQSAALLGMWENSVAAWSQRDALRPQPFDNIVPPEDASLALSLRSSHGAQAVRQAAALAVGASHAAGVDDVSGLALSDFITTQAIARASSSTATPPAMAAGSVTSAQFVHTPPGVHSSPAGTERNLPADLPASGSHTQRYVDPDDFNGSVTPLTPPAGHSEVRDPRRLAGHIVPASLLTPHPVAPPHGAPIAMVVAYDVDVLAHQLQAGGGIGQRQLQSLVSHAELLRKMATTNVDLPAAVFPSLAKMLYAILSPQQISMVQEQSALGAALREATATDIQRHTISFVTHNASADAALATALSVAVSGRASSILDAATATVVGSAVSSAVLDVLRVHAASPTPSQIANSIVAALSTFYGIARQGTSAQATSSDTQRPSSRAAGAASKSVYGAMGRLPSRKHAKELAAGSAPPPEGATVHPLSSVALSSGKDVWSAIADGVTQPIASMPPVQADGSAYAYFPSNCPIPYCPCPCHFPSANSEDDSESADPEHRSGEVAVSRAVRKKRQAATRAAAQWGLSSGPLGLGPVLDATVPVVSPIEAVVRAWARALALRGRTLWHRGGGFSGFSRQLVDTFYAAGHLPQDAIMSWPKNVSKKWTPEAAAKSTMTITSYVPNPTEAADGPAVAAALGLALGRPQSPSTAGTRGAGSGALPSRSPVSMPVGGMTEFTPVMTVLAAAAAAARQAYQAQHTAAAAAAAASAHPRGPPADRLLAMLTGVAFGPDILAAKNGTVLSEGVIGLHPNHAVELPSWPVQGANTGVTRGVSHSKSPPPGPPPYLKSAPPIVPSGGATADLPISTFQFQLGGDTPPSDAASTFDAEASPTRRPLPPVKAPMPPGAQNTLRAVGGAALPEASTGTAGAVGPMAAVSPTPPGFVGATSRPPPPPGGARPALPSTAPAPVAKPTAPSVVARPPPAASAGLAIGRSGGARAVGGRLRG